MLTVNRVNGKRRVDSKRRGGMLKNRNSVDLRSPLYIIGNNFPDILKENEQMRRENVVIILING